MVNLLRNYDKSKFCLQSSQVPDQHLIVKWVGPGKSSNHV